MKLVGISTLYDTTSKTQQLAIAMPVQSSSTGVEPEYTLFHATFLTTDRQWTSSNSKRITDY